ncbi:MAG: hypothetical protein KGN02_12920 [bacterium]|nr:hypothetical protein [bacterium]
MSSARILRVGGSESDFATLEALLRDAGYTDVRFVASADAVEALQAREADLLILDLLQNSADVFALMRAAGPTTGRTSRVPVLVTAPASAADRIEACLQRGAEDYLVTPFDPAHALVVTRRIELCIQRKHLREFTVRLRASRPEINETAVIELYSQASRKFVPREFLNHLGRETIAEVALGDHVARQMTVFFSDIRDFTALSEAMSPQDNFAFLNSYLRNATPIIREHGGFIDKYIGDAIMALFPEEPVHALEAAVGLQKMLVGYNAGRGKAGYVPIRVGIGLHRGDLILGTIGEAERMQTTVIADAVNVASRIEGLTKTFGVSLLVSSSVVDALPQGHEFSLRHLGAVQAKGKTKSVEIYECFDTDSVEQHALKAETAELFSRAVADFRKGLLLSAHRAFSRVVLANPLDTVAAYYRDSCTKTVLIDRKAEFDGIERVEVK